MSGNRFGVLFVCTGNICRSPTAEAVFRKLAAQAGLAQVILADSAGTHGYHIGEPPDPRAQDAAAKRGYDLSGLRARRFEQADFQRFDLILAMDRDHHSILLRMARPSAAHKLKLMMSYARRLGLDTRAGLNQFQSAFLERALDLRRIGRVRSRWSRPRDLSRSGLILRRCLRRRRRLARPLGFLQRRRRIG